MTTEYANFTDDDVPQPRPHTGGPRGTINTSGLYVLMDWDAGAWIGSHDTVRAEP